MAGLWPSGDRRAAESKVDLDGFIQEIIKVVDKKAEEIKEVLEGKPTAKPKKVVKPAKASKSKK